MATNASSTGVSSFLIVTDSDGYRLRFGGKFGSNPEVNPRVNFTIFSLRCLLKFAGLAA
jgi:hypothetical protein